ncbi:MAG: phage tail sheath family protein [Candidatus Cloacimonetes bacterium]|nr:phage tail sheath family protein [Candidatus Cloacimonadota bacterium]
MAFFHGVRTSEVPTNLIPPARINASLPFVVGPAPIHRLSAEQQAVVKPGGMSLIFSNAEASEQLGIDGAKDNKEKWGLSGFVFNRFTLFNVSPAILVNIFDPDIHKTTITGEVTAWDGMEYTLQNTDIIGQLSLEKNSIPYEQDVDFTFNPVTGVVTVIAGSQLATAITSSDVITANYTFADLSKITADDYIGGYDIVTGKSTGLELINLAFPRFRMVPQVIRCTTADPVVTMVATAKSRNINSVFNAIVVADISDSEVTLYSSVPQYKNDNNLVDANLYLCWPRLKFGDSTLSMADQASCMLSVVDSNNGDIPFASPSNKNLQCSGAMVGSEELWLDLAKANYLNSNGITTALNFTNGWVLWGNRTATYPGATDPKDVFISNRRMMTWYGNRLVLTWFQKVDFPINRRLLETIKNSEQMSLNSFQSAGAITGGRIEFNQEENPLTDLMDGKVVFHVFLGLVAPAEEINFLLEFDPSYLETLFG